jgi:hypothetical protein
MEEHFKIQLLKPGMEKMKIELPLNKLLLKDARLMELHKLEFMEVLKTQKLLNLYS